MEKEGLEREGLHGVRFIIGGGIGDDETGAAEIFRFTVALGVEMLNYHRCLKTVLDPDPDPGAWKLTNILRLDQLERRVRTAHGARSATRPPLV